MIIKIFHYFTITVGARPLSKGWGLCPVCPVVPASLICILLATFKNPSKVLLILEIFQKPKDKLPIASGHWGAALIKKTTYIVTYIPSKGLHILYTSPTTIEDT